MTKNIKGHILLYQQVVNSMHSDCSVEGVMNTTSSNVRPIHVSIQVEMDRISTKTECLTCSSYLYILNPSNNLIIWSFVEHNLRSKLVIYFLSPKPTKETNLNCKLTRIKVCWTVLNSCGPSLIGVALNNDISCQIAHFSTSCDDSSTNSLSHSYVSVLKRRRNCESHSIRTNGCDT